MQKEFYLNTAAQPMGMFRYDFHVHTNASVDCKIPPERVVGRALRLGLTGLAITDHNTIKGALAAREFAKKNKLNLQIIIGQERNTDKGELLALFLRRGLRSKIFHEAVAEAKSQKALLVLPHPMRNQPEILAFAHIFDFVEVHNGRSYPEENEGAMRLARLHSIKPLCGSDAHWLSELGNATVTFRRAANIKAQLLSGEYSLTQNPKSRMSIFLHRNTTAFVKGGLPFLLRKAFHW